MSLQTVLNQVFQALGQVFRVPTASAYSQARQKVDPEVFRDLTRSLVADFYEVYGADGEVTVWRGHRLMGVDGSSVTVPDTPETRSRWSVQTNQYEGVATVQVLMSVLYDVLNDLGVNVAIGRRQAETKFIVESHLAHLHDGDVVVLDRAYDDYVLMAALNASQCGFVIRIPRKSMKPINDFWASTDVERVVTLRCPAAARAGVVARHLPETIQVRLIKVVLDTGDIEVLATSLLDPVAYPRHEFKLVYHWRWNQETYFDRIKNMFELERFSSPTVRGIEQDLFGVIFLATLEGILTRPAHQELARRGEQRQLQNPPKVNRATSYVTLLDSVVLLLYDHRASPHETLAAIQHLFLRNPTSHREGRQFERNKKRTYPLKLKFYKYVKRIIA